MAESLQFSIGADTQNFNSGIEGMLGKLAGLAAAFISLQGIVNAFSDAIDMGGRLHDLSTRTGETAGTLAILERAFDNTNVGAEKLGPAINKMQKSMTDLAGGSDSAVAAFTQLGLSWNDLANKSPAEQMALIGQRLAAIENPALRAETAMNIFGKSGGELIPILTNFASETAQARAQLGSLPDQLDATAAGVDSLGDNLFAIRNKLTEMAYGFLVEVLPAVEAFTKKFAEIDAAAIGAGIADILVGAFANPMKAAELLGDALLLGAQNYGNLLFSTADYFGQLIGNTIEALGISIPLIGQGLIEGATGFGSVLLSVFSDGLAAMQGISALFSSVGIVVGPAFEAAISVIDSAKANLGSLASDALESAASAGSKVMDAFASAYENTQFIKQDFFGASETSAKIAEDFASLKQSARDAVSSLTPVGPLAPQSGAEVTDADRAAIAARLEADRKVIQTPVTASTGGGGKTAAQIAADQKRALSLIAGATSTQAIGQSASAIRAQELQKQLDTLAALGKEDTSEFAAIQRSLQTHTDIAFGNLLTAQDKEAARSWAFDQYTKDTSQSMLDLQAQAEQNILEQKRAGDTKATDAQKAKAAEAGAGGGKAAQQPMTMQSIANSVLQILQKIEPKIPQHIMT